jgi:myo-inositol 2-dehydrogenase / D-chiro-inositol 1-dehydrogenase
VSQSPIGIGLIGCGFIGRFHSISIRSLIKRGLVQAEYRAVCDLDPNRAQSFADAAGVPLVASDWRDVVNSPEVGVVYVCVPTAGHKELVLRAAEQGKHVFCEKPLATNLADVEEMVAAVNRAGVNAGAGLILRHSPILTALKALTEDPGLGRLMTIVFRDDQFFPIQGHYHSEWRKDRSVAGGGTLLEHSIHDIDVLRWLAGEVSSVNGTVQNFTGHDGIEDLAIAHLEFASGAQAQLTSVWHNVLARPSSRRLELFFENGYFHIENDFIGAIYLQRGAAVAEVVTEEQVLARYFELVGLNEAIFGDMLRYSLEDYFFVDSIASGRKPFPDFAEALQAHRIVDAIYRSASAAGDKIRLL